MNQKRIYRLVIFIFLVVIFLPSVGLFQKTDEKDIEKNLNRMPYLFPEWHLNKLNQIDFPAIEKWYGDKASFISTLSKIWSDTNYYFGISAKPNSVIIGKNGWFFTGNDAGHNVNQWDFNSIDKSER